MLNLEQVKSYYPNNLKKFGLYSIDLEKSEEIFLI